MLEVVHFCAWYLFTLLSVLANILKFVKLYMPGREKHAWMSIVDVACFDILSCLLHTPDQQNSCVKRCEEFILFALLLPLKYEKSVIIKQVGRLPNTN